ncbi:hypothetical protein CC86DRAFT_188153 [Ophiobolus disseminans]|uniref:Uncharacterized protein n=1 Tax=Ophiobolus disseminans TaxID=1469910 RepID=A0A6A7A9N5_9PLEO|nr:hypothetical protein CC86DRAFT_188153 [Ophiobolus disseminans]
MLYFIHNPAGNIVIRTTNPYIILQYQHRGWITATSFSDVLAAHPEWRSPPPSPTRGTPAKGFSATLFTTLFGRLSATLAFVPTYTAAGVASVAPLLARTHSSARSSQEEVENEEQPSNTSPLHFLTAVERKWYFERGYTTPRSAWVMCTEGDEVFDYRLEEGEWDVDVAAQEAVNDGKRKGVVGKAM